MDFDVVQSGWSLARSFFKLAAVSRVLTADSHAHSRGGLPAHAAPSQEVPLANGMTQAR
jgi:hypothetical protein